MKNFSHDIAVAGSVGLSESSFLSFVGFLILLSNSSAYLSFDKLSDGNSLKNYFSRFLIVYLSYLA